jgi:hypothetical protein
LREDVEDQRRPVEHLDVEFLLEVALLRRRQLVVEDDGGVVERLTLGDDLLDLALADVGRRVAALQPLGGGTDDARARRTGEKRQLFERALGVPAAPEAVLPFAVAAPVLELRRDEERSLRGFGRIV